MGLPAKPRILLRLYNLAGAATLTLVTAVACAASHGVGAQPPDQSAEARGAAVMTGNHATLSGARLQTIGGAPAQHDFSRWRKANSVIAFLLPKHSAFLHTLTPDELARWGCRVEVGNLQTDEIDQLIGIIEGNMLINSDHERQTRNRDYRIGIILKKNKEKIGTFYAGGWDSRHRDYALLDDEVIGILPTFRDAFMTWLNSYHTDGNCMTL